MTKKRCKKWLDSAPTGQDDESAKKRDLAFAKSLFLRVPGLEPGAFWFVAKRSIQLGYIRVLSSFVDVPKYRIIDEIVKGEGLKKWKKVFVTGNGVLYAVFEPLFACGVFEQALFFSYFCPQPFLAY